MGTFHTFGELQQFADKLVKFKQAVLLNVNKGNIPKEHFELAKGGACASFAMGWIAQQFGGKKYYHRAKGIPSKKDTYSADSMMSMLAANSEYMKALTVGDMDIKFLAIDYSLEVVDQAPEAPVDLPFLAREASRAGAGSAIFAWLTIADSATGHAVAYHADSDGRVHFFDPNIGEYALHAVTTREFFVAYTDILASRFKWRYGWMTPFTIKLDATDTSATTSDIMAGIFSN